MDKIIFLSADNPNATTGAAKFIRMLFHDTGIFEKRGFQIIGFSNDDLYSDEKLYKTTITFRIKQFVKGILAKTTWGRNVAFFNYQINVLGKKPLKEASFCIGKNTPVVLNDFRVAWNFFKKYGNSSKTIFMMHNNGDLFSMMRNEENTGRMKKFFIECEKMIFENVGKIVFVSENARLYFENIYPEYIHKTKTIYNGLNEKHASKNEVNKPIVFISVGTICKRKNQLLAIKAIEKLKYDNVMLKLIGEGPELDEYKKYVEDHKLQEKVIFIGTSLEVDKHLQASDIFIMTSINEGLPVAAQEAMAASLPLILTDVGGCRELIDNNGILTTLDLDEVISAMQFFCDNKELIIPYGRRSYEIYNNKFSVDVMQSKYADLFREIMLP